MPKLCIICLLVCILTPLSLSIAPASHSYFRNFFNHVKDYGKSNEKFLKRFVELRTGDNGDKPAFWHHSGVIRNPSNGVAIAGVEGIEYTVPFPCQPVALNNLTTLTNQLNVLSGQNTTTTYSYLTKKLFFYVNPHNPKELLTQFRVQRSAPARPVNPLASFAQIITYFRHPQSENLQCVIEFPSSRKLYSRKMQVIADEARGVGEEEPEALPSSPRRHSKITERYHVGNMITGGKAQGRRWPGSWVSLSATGVSPLQGRSQEFFSIWRQTPPSGPAHWLSFLSKMKQGLVKLGRQVEEEEEAASAQGVQMDYIRYGEAPAWAVPGLPCVTELHATCYGPHYNSLPAGIQALVDQHHPRFLLELSRLQERALDLVELQDCFHRQEIDAFQSFAKPWYRKLLGNGKEKRSCC